MFVSKKRKKRERECLTGMYWYIFYKDQLLLQKQGEGYSVPCMCECPVRVEQTLPVEMPDGTRAMAAYTDEPLEETEAFLPMGLRASYDYLERHFYEQAGKAYEIVYWDQHSRFCPVCGTPTEQQGLIMKKCPRCGNEMFPAISPAILVLIRKGEEILLVRARNFRGTFYGLVAGFLETGETLEQCVEREVKEETGLLIRNISYFGNQPWPYPSGLMIGFVADYAGGEIRLQDEELSAAEFFSKDKLPEIPHKLSLARKMIDWWLEQ
jgi:NAD+ diphosphatase